MDVIVAFLRTMIRAGTPLLLATLGEIYTERSGIINLGLEGMMIVGASVAYVVAYHTGNPILGILTAICISGAMALIHAFLSITLRSNQIISGLALTMIGVGLSSYIGRDYVGKVGVKLPEIPIYPLSAIPYIGEILFEYDPIVYASLILTFILWFTLYRTKIGIIVRSVGENPSVADSQGVNVYLVRYICTILGGMLAGLSGAYLSLSYVPAWVEGMTGGRGWIAIALTIFAMWDPLKALIGAYLFGGIEVLQYNLQPMGIPPNILAMTPYILTIVTLFIASREKLRRRIGAPACLGQPYTREA